jgi:hypothetical protein
MMTDRARGGSIAACKSRDSNAFSSMNDNKEIPANCALTPEIPDKNNNDKFQDTV